MIMRRKRTDLHKTMRETEYLLSKIKEGTTLSASQQLKLVLHLSLPDVMAQITVIVM